MTDPITTPAEPTPLRDGDLAIIRHKGHRGTPGEPHLARYRDMWGDGETVSWQAFGSDYEGDVDEYDVIERVRVMPQPAEPASAAAVSDSPTDAGSGRSGDPGGRNEASGDIVETAARVLWRNRAGLNEPRWDEVAASSWMYVTAADQEDWRRQARQVLAAVTPLIATQERAKVRAQVAEEIAREIERHARELPAVRDLDGGSAFRRAARIARAARPVTGEG